MTLTRGSSAAMRSSSSGGGVGGAVVDEHQLEGVVGDRGAGAAHEALDELLLVVDGGDYAEQGRAAGGVGHREWKSASVAAVGSVDETIESVMDGPTVVDAPKAKLNPTIVAQFVKFGIVGVSNTLLSLAVYAVLLKVFGVCVPGGLGDRLRRGDRQRLSVEQPLDLPRATWGTR